MSVLATEDTRAKEFLSFNDESKSPFHATAAIAAMLRKNGFQAISEAERWSLEKGGRYFFTRAGSSIVAFAVGEDYNAENSSFSIIGAHTDSPCFKVKPVSTVNTHGYVQLGVECYGGGLWHTWFDRDLTVAGRVVVRDAESGALQFRLVSVPKPILRIPNLAIHLSRNVNTEGFKLNKETDTTPILATNLATAMNGVAARPEGKKTAGSLAVDRHPVMLIQVLAKELNVDAGSIVDLDLCVSDTQPAAIGGALDEFVFAPRLDNLASCFTATRALIESVSGTSTGTDCSSVRMVCCFDHEEVGSSSSHGADSPLLQESVRRIVESLGGDYYLTMRRSLLVSADMAHGIHPNYSGKHEVNHRPKLGGGLVIKTNQNQRYATSGVTGLIVREAARRARVEVQEFVVPNDKPCGSTIGPILSSATGLRTVDVGQPQLSMHSVREMCAGADFAKTEAVFCAVFEHFRAIDLAICGEEIVE